MGAMGAMGAQETLGSGAKGSAMGAHASEGEGSAMRAQETLGSEGEGSGMGAMGAQEARQWLWREIICLGSETARGAPFRDAKKILL